MDLSRVRFQPPSHQATFGRRLASPAALVAWLDQGNSMLSHVYVVDLGGPGGGPCRKLFRPSTSLGALKLMSRAR